MPSLPRLALATPAADPEPAVATLALLGALTRRGWKVQHFRAWACPVNTQITGPITGLPGRHLDSWLMPPDVCREVFWRGARNSDLAIIEGALSEVARPSEPIECPWRLFSERHGPIRPQIEALDLPVVAIVDCLGWNGQHLPCIAPEADAVILDGIDQVQQFESLRSMVSLLSGKPVLGAVESFPAIRSTLAQLPLGRSVPGEIVEQLARSFLRFADLDAIRAVSESRSDEIFDDCIESKPWRGPRGRRLVRVAYAMDEAFGGYFPDTLEAIELLGASLVEFSPLRDETLPPDIDLVMIGCGFPERYADELAANHSLIAALRSHVCRGGRVYTEGGGTAYLGRSLIADGRQVPLAGVLPFDAELLQVPVWPEPVERTLAQDGWLGSIGTVVRGYRSNRWKLHPAPEPGDCPTRSGVLTEESDIYFRSRAVGSLIHLHLGALPDVVAAFVGRGCEVPSARTRGLH